MRAGCPALVYVPHVGNQDLERHQGHNTQKKVHPRLGDTNRRAGGILHQMRL